MGAPLGNQNAAKGRIWQAAINRAIERRSRVEAREMLDDLADKLISLAHEGDLAALRELGDRLEGKPAQMVGIGQDPNADPVQVQRVERVIVRGNAAD